jgi:RNA polymerase sigma-70 factor, ECF subfamily
VPAALLDPLPSNDSVDQLLWAEIVRQVVEELPLPRDREILSRFYLSDEDCTVICDDLKLAREHFNRVLFRVRNRFPERLIERGLLKAAFLSSTS